MPLCRRDRAYIFFHEAGRWNTPSALEEFTTANLDFIQHYRPTQNVLKRPTQSSGQSIALTGHHEIMVPLIAAALKASLAEG